MKGPVAVLASVICLVLAASPAPAEKARGGIIVSAAASLSNVMQDLGADFEKSHPEVGITFNFGASGDLLAQMRQGAPVDIFASASESHMDKALAMGLMKEESIQTFAVNSLVLACPAAGTIPLSGLGDLTDSRVERIGIGKPETVPAGQYARAALESAGIWPMLQEKLIFGNSVRQVLDYLRRGEVDAGLIYATDARVAREQVRVVAEAGDSSILYPVAMLNTSRHPELATKFLQYLTGDAARAIMINHGFKSP